MASRARGYRQDWEREEFDETYEAQYPDDDVHGGVQLDHCKLYVTNINRALNEEGLVTAFSKYGTLVKVHVSRDPIKRYALITFETPGEAKLAMMKLNKTEPLKLNIHIAHKKNCQDQKEDGRKFKHRESSSYRDDASVSSKGRRKQDDFTNGDNIDIEEALCDEDLGLDTDLELEMTQLKMKQLQLQQAQLQCKQQMLLLNRGGKKATPKPNRCILPDGRIVVRNNSDKSDQPDHTYSSAAGDSRESSRACLTCGSAADFYCGACALAQYCSQRCQQKDWNARHKFVCHNLACLNGSEGKPKETLVDISEPVLSPPAALRQPNVHQKKDYKQDDNKPKKNFNSNNKPSRANLTFKNKTFRHPMRQKEEKNAPASFDGTEPQSIQNEKREPEKPTENQPELKSEASFNIKADIHPKDHNVPPKPPGSVLDTTPKSKAIVPKNYAVEALCAGESLLLSVDAAAADCAAGAGFVCVALHRANEDDYRLLCGDFGPDCDKEQDIEAGVGSTCALLAAGEAAWYRARVLSRSHAALLDAARLLPLAAAARCVALPPRYERLPECCCRLRADGVRLNDNLKCTLVSKTADGYKVSLENAESGATVGEGEVSRWKPNIEYEATKPVSNVSIPEVPRPPLIDKSTVVIVDATAADKVYVRSAALEDTKKFASVLQDGILVGMKVPPVCEPPQRGCTVVARHTDGHCYRALCTRTNVKQNKYLLEYIEYGNTDISTKEKIYPCPQDLDLSNKPTTVSLVKLDIDMALNKNGLEYLEQLRDGDVELVLHTAERSPAPSGSRVQLTVLQTKESVNHKLKQLCSPEWKKIEEKGGDVLECEPLMYGALQYQPLPAGPCSLAVLDVSTLRAGALGVCDVTMRHDALLADITAQIAAYVKSDIGKEPYLPRNEELCIAQCPPYEQYYRAVLCDHSPGSSEATVCFMDYNNVETVSVSTIRRMMPEFLTTPALACHAEIRGFPESPSDEQLARAVLHMKIDDEGRGELSVERCEGVDPGFYVLHAPGLLAALQQQ